ncbi:DUF2975 domain-containing protein [Secundilactobacillus silagei]|uniref:DUF2975 domain-containing protein n=1 Tax=Secundilactobacillus silagei JCM 19001 TaxID=1302250 RepID=A0A1Z5H4Z4_9LACO|nr:DUF2975 domain-containing protein [Secundilactobacillus silagei]TDG70249.1 hypothetical protein C5L25_001439 [Secundilactobacillus silagei JCM 19001]GAT17979.1 hypothetical protein IWT126_00236 [Secundilactobacillus silagei JCM 19001]
MKIRSWFLQLCLLAASCLVILLAGLLFWRIPIHAVPAGMPALQAYALTIGLYVSAISFIVLAVFAWQLLHLISQQLVFTAKTVQLFVALKWSCVGIQLGALTMLPGIYLVADRTDAPGVMAMGLIFYAVWLFMTVFFAILQRLWATAVAFKHVSNDSE